MSAPVALVEVTAQDRGPAVANVSQRFPLLARQHRVPASQEIVLMGAEDIGQFQPMSVSSVGRNQVEIERIQRTGRRAHGHVGDLQIARGGFQVGVAEQDLNGAEIDAGFEQMGGEGVPQRVRMNRFGDAGRVRGFPASQEDRFRTEMGWAGSRAGK